MSDEKDLQKARASAAAEERRRGRIVCAGRKASSPGPFSEMERGSELSLAQRTRELLRRYDLRARKTFGQNFLINPVKVGQIAAAALGALELTEAETIIEVGPGLGALTVALAEGGPDANRPLRERRPPLVAFEIDRSLQAPLGELLAPYPQVTVRFEDFLEADLRAALGQQPYVAAGNLPYNITAPLLEKLLSDPLCRALVITVQREVADRLRAAPDSKAYGPLTLFAAYYVREVELLTPLRPGDFLPPPQVDSTALRLVKRPEPPFATPSAQSFERAVRAAFNHRRKSLRSGLALATRLDLTREQVQTALDRAAIQGDRRAETLTLEEFAQLAQALEEVGANG